MEVSVAFPAEDVRLTVARTLASPIEEQHPVAVTDEHPREALARLEQRARRRFGQHFLWRTDIVDRIVLGARVEAGDRVLEVGPGLGILTRKLLQDRSPGGMPIGFIDDDPQKRWLKLEGLPVLGAALDLPEILRTRAVSEVIISIEDLPFDRLLSLQDICAARGVPLKRARFAIEDVSLEPAAFDLVGYDR